MAFKTVGEDWPKFCYFPLSYSTVVDPDARTMSKTEHNPEAESWLPHLVVFRTMQIHPPGTRPSLPKLEAKAGAGILFSIRLGVRSLQVVEFWECVI